MFGVDVQRDSFLDSDILTFIVSEGIHDCGLQGEKLPNEVETGKMTLSKHHKK